MAASTRFGLDFQEALRGLIAVHHSIYPLVPPQGIYFEALVERAFKRTQRPFTWIQPTGRNQPRHDLLVENTRISLKTETGKGTKEERIHITKLCTTEREPWTATDLLQRVSEHLGRYDMILMLRAVWRLPIIRYQFLEIPIEVLRLITTASLVRVGTRKGRGSLGADVHLDAEVAFHVHFDAADGKCQVRNFPISRCKMIDSWDVLAKD